MCGGYGLYRLVGLVGASASQAAQDSVIPTVEARDRLSVMEQQVKLMYARGEIGAEAFRRLLTLVRADKLSPHDLTAFQTTIGADLIPVEMDPHQPSVFAGYEHRLTEERSHLEAACVETEGSIKRLQLEAAGLYQQAENQVVDNWLVGCDKGQIDAFSETVRARARSVEERLKLIQERLSRLRTRLDDLIEQERLARVQP
jgi:hypothetical protein